ncbi:MAG TPA: ATP-binding protein [Bryobacteraceae bacterium]|jgi:light-regulated signal transduction histidine kinase (bacteriophytochrome)|nr:ATP-binding protein [Bryobacteraceae bacterium]
MARAADGSPRQSSGENCSVPFNSDSLHDLMSPVNQIGTISELLFTKYRGALDEDAETLFGFIQSSASRLQNLLAGLRTYMRVAGAPSCCRLCDANMLLAGAKASLQPEIDQNGAVVTHDPLPELYCDPSQIGYALASLIENAIKFRCEHRPEVHVSAAAEENNWRFSVKDNGMGIDPRNGDRIFGLFKRIQNEGYPGAGVGLAIVRQIVEQHGGRIWVESQPGRGATFFFSLPRQP